MPRRAGDAFKAQLEHQRRLHAAHGAEAFAGGLTHDGLDVAHILIGQTGIRIGKAISVRSASSSAPHLCA